MDVQNKKYSDLKSSMGVLEFRPGHEDLLLWGFYTILKFSYEVKDGDFHLTHQVDHLLSEDNVKAIGAGYMEGYKHLEGIEYLLIKTGEGEDDFALFSFRIRKGINELNIVLSNHSPQSPNLIYKKQLERVSLMKRPE